MFKIFKKRDMTDQKKIDRMIQGYKHIFINYEKTAVNRSIGVISQEQYENILDSCLQMHTNWMVLNEPKTDIEAAVLNALSEILIYHREKMIDETKELIDSIEI